MSSLCNSDFKSLLNRHESCSRCNRDGMYCPSPLFLLTGKFQSSVITAGIYLTRGSSTAVYFSTALKFSVWTFALHGLLKCLNHWITDPRGKKETERGAGMMKIKKQRGGLIQLVWGWRRFMDVSGAFWRVFPTYWLDILFCFSTIHMRSAVSRSKISFSLFFCVFLLELVTSIYLVFGRCIMSSSSHWINLWEISLGNLEYTKKTVYMQAIKRLVKCFQVKNMVWKSPGANMLTDLLHTVSGEDTDYWSVVIQSQREWVESAGILPRVSKNSSWEIWRVAAKTALYKKL